VRALPGRQQKFDIFGNVLHAHFSWILKAAHVHVHEHVNINVYVYVNAGRKP
jgi:hypothetical protein